ncbi:stealth conserved region 3 domain-containing protein [Thauera sp. SDU_THAU2]|uniref:stealth conserved region 3 domain-containing protein n=1 Tax=Thauera sp. SDU_THAU2 TaxID=3136633 RepID=UPI004055171D
MHRHAPYSLCRSVYDRMIRDYPREADTTCSARFRSRDDVPFTSSSTTTSPWLRPGRGRGRGVPDPRVDEFPPVPQAQAVSQHSLPERRRQQRRWTRTIAPKLEFLSRHYAFKSPCERQALADAGAGIDTGRGTELQKSRHADARPRSRGKGAAPKPTDQLRCPAMRRVLTYGTFDTLHHGHVRLLRRARALGTT